MKNAGTVDLSAVRKAISDGELSPLITRLSTELQESSTSTHTRILAFINRAFARLALEMATAAIQDCAESIKLDPTVSIAYLLQGIAYLWNSNEPQAMAVWSEGLDGVCSLPFFSLMLSLINNPNFRAWLIGHRFDIGSLFTIIEKWDQLKIFTENAEQVAFDDLRTRAPRDSVLHFSQIIGSDPRPSAYKGRGIAHCLAGQWEEAVADFTTALTKTRKADNTLKYRAHAQLALGRLSMALVDLAQYEAVNPGDQEAVLMRATTELKMGHFLPALTRFRSVDESLLENGHWLAYAETLYHFGLFSQAQVALSRCAHHNSKYFFVKFLTHKALGELSRAETAIIEAAKDKPGFAVARTAGDYFFDRGNPRRALHFYGTAVMERRESADMIVTHAEANMTCGDLQRAVEFLRPVAAAFFQRQRRMEYALHSQNTFFHRPSRGADIFRIAANDLMIAHAMVQNWDKCIQAVPREFYPTWAEFGSDRILTPFAELSADARAMLVDADRLGAKCTGVGISRMVARALGFCVLRLCYLMTALKEDRRFLELALDDIRLLLTFADFRRQVFHGRSDLGTSRRSPTYCVVVEGGGISRFSRMRSVIFQMIHARYGVSDIRELILKSKGPRFVLETHFDYHYLPEKRLPAPSIVVTNSAVFGVDVSVQIHTESSIAKKYEAELHESFQSLFLDEEDQLTSLARIMLMIWLLHPLPAYSEELAYVVFNAAILALRRLEATKRIKRSAFVNQVVTPDLGTLRKALQARTLVESQVRPASLAFWSELPTFAVMYSLMRLDVDVAVQTDPT